MEHPKSDYVWTSRNLHKIIKGDTPYQNLRLATTLTTWKKCFSVIDIKKRYWQQELDYQSCLLCTFNMLFKGYRFKYFPDPHHIYTDGSKQEMKVGCAGVFQNYELLKCLPNESSICSAEVLAIDLAMDIIANHKSSKFIIYSDSKSVLQALQSKNSSTPLITRLLDKMNTLSKNNSIILTWIPSHIGILVNERALQTRISNTKIPYTDLKPLINKFILKKWQKS